MPLDLQASPRPSGGSPDPRQPPFGVGTSPIHRVMGFLRLSAGGLRFLGHRFPLRSCALLASGLPTGPDLIGVSTFRNDENRPGWVPSIPREPGVLRSPCIGRGPCGAAVAVGSCSVIAGSAVAATNVSRGLVEGSLAFTRPVSPWPDAPFGWEQSWALPSASDHIVTNGIWDGRGWASDTGPET